MGGICVKPAGGSPRERRSSKLSSESHRSQSTREESFRVKNRFEVRTGSIDKRLNPPRCVRDDYIENKKERSRAILDTNIRTIPKTVEGEHIVAGWPSWLAEVAGEAIHGWLPRRADTFEKLDKIGQGTYSSVYKACDLMNKKFVALKRVRFDNMDSDSVKFMAREILILRRLDHPNIIKLEGLITSRTSCSIYLIFEYMEHDLSGLSSLPGAKFTEPQVKCYMKQLLTGLDYCHTRGVLHRDIKGSNLLINNHGILKIADFGLASLFDHRRNVPLTSRVVTLWYRPPELLLGATHYGVAVDLWSAGCILGELYAGKPIMPGQTEVEQLHRIFKLCGSPSDDYWIKSKLPQSAEFKTVQPYKRCIVEAFKDFPSAAIRLMETLLAIDPEQRGNAALALKSEFFTCKPYACDPSTLPQYPPSKEIDAKMRDEEARRQRAARMNSHKHDKESKGPKETRTVPAAHANAELFTSMQRRHEISQSKSELFSKHKEGTASGFCIEKPKFPNGSKDANKDVELCPPTRDSYSGPLVAGKKFGEISTTNRYGLYMHSGSVASFDDALSEKLKDQGGHLCEYAKEFGRASNKESTNGGNIHFSGPVDLMLKDHERQIQEAARRVRLEKIRLMKEAAQMTRNPVYSCSRGKG